jgi:CO dehydrogenase maturation factor
VRVAIAGKGGAGKTTIAATLARTAARTGSTVLAIDADSNPNLATAIGAGASPGALPAELVSRRHDGPALTVSVDDLIREHTVAGPDRVRIALMGMPAHAGQGCLCSAHATVSAVLADLGEAPDHLVVIDMEASPEHLSRGTARHVDHLLLVTEPYYRSLETARRLAALASELPIGRVSVIGNKVRRPEEAEAIDEFCARHDLELLATVPWSAAVMDSDVEGVPLIERSPHDPATRALSAVTSTLTGELTGSGT